MAFVEFVLYYVILYVLLLITSYSSLKIVKCTIGKNVKEQFNKKQFQKMFWFTILSYLIGVIPLLLWELCDIKSYSNGIELIIASIFFLCYLFLQHQIILLFFLVKQYCIYQ